MGMAKEPNTPFEMPVDMRAAAERGLEQARKAFDQFLEAAKTSLATAEDHSKVAQQSAKEISTTVVALAEQNIFSAFDYAQKLIQAKDPQTLIQLQIDFIRAQMQGLSEQAKALGDTMTKAASETIKKK